MPLHPGRNVGSRAAMQKYMRKIGANPGRSGHRLSVEAARVIYDTREKLAQLFNITDPLQIVMTKSDGRIEHCDLRPAEIRRSMSSHPAWNIIR